jgi:hypothetical protein
MTAEASSLLAFRSKSNSYQPVLPIHRNAVLPAARKERLGKPAEVKSMSETAITTEKRCFLQCALNVRKKPGCLSYQVRINLYTAEHAITKSGKTGNSGNILIK